MSTESNMDRIRRALPSPHDAVVGSHYVPSLFSGRNEAIALASASGYNKNPLRLGGVPRDDGEHSQSLHRNLRLPDEPGRYGADRRSIETVRIRTDSGCRSSRRDSPEYLRDS